MDDRKRAEALLRRIGKHPWPSYVDAILAAFAEERRLERERCARALERPSLPGDLPFTEAADVIRAMGAPPQNAMGVCDSMEKPHERCECNWRPIAEGPAAGASAGPAEGLPPAESQGAPTASAPQDPDWGRALLRSITSQPTENAALRVLRVALKTAQQAPTTPQPEPLREARWCSCNDPACPLGHGPLAAATSAQPRDPVGHQLSMKHEPDCPWSPVNNDCTCRPSRQLPTPQASETPLNTRTARSADGLPVVDFDRDALRRMPTQASETPAEGEVWNALESLLDAYAHVANCRECGETSVEHCAASEGENSPAAKAIAAAEAATALLARRPHGR